MKKQFNLQEWLKDKSQKVETRDGRIVHDIWRVKEPFYVNNRKAEVCALIDGEEDALVFFEDGRYLPTTQDTDNPFDLFIVTTEEELTEFEKKVKEIADCKEDCSYLGNTIYKSIAAELRVIAFREFKENEATHMKAFMDYERITAYEKGKADALKDLPRWKKIKEADNACVREPHVGTNMIGEKMLYIGNHAISISRLEKLPGFKEDESDLIEMRHLKECIK